MNTTSKKSNYWFITLVSFFTVLFVMPLGHALMITMEHLMDRTTMHYSAFAMGAVGLFMVIRGVFTKEIPGKRYGGFLEGFSSGPVGWNSSLCITPTATGYNLKL